MELFLGLLVGGYAKSWRQMFKIAAAVGGAVIALKVLLIVAYSSVLLDWLSLSLYGIEMINTFLGIGAVSAVFFAVKRVFREARPSA